MEAVEEGLEETILSDLLLRPKYYPYSTYRDGFRGAQGIYLSKLSTSLLAAFRELSAERRIPDKISPTDTTRTIALEYAEGERSLREYWFFKRNPALRAAAIDRHGLNCAACELNFTSKYGGLGEGYIEIHHLNPLAERNDGIRGTLTTSIDDVVPVCANCHRMIHRRHPALSIGELQSLLRAASGSESIS